MERNIDKGWIIIILRKMERIIDNDGDSDNDHADIMYNTVLFKGKR